MKVRVFHCMHKPLPPDHVTEDFPGRYRIRPKKLSWEEAFAKLEKDLPESLVDIDPSKEQTGPEIPQ